MFLPALLTESSYKPVLTSPVPIIRTGALDLETGDPSAERGQLFPPLPVPIIRTGTFDGTRDIGIRWDGSEGVYRNSHGNEVSIDRLRQIVKEWFGLVWDGHNFRNETGEIVSWEELHRLIASERKVA